MLDLNLHTPPSRITIDFVTSPTPFTARKVVHPAVLKSESASFRNVAKILRCGIAWCPEHPEAKTQLTRAAGCKNGGHRCCTIDIPLAFANWRVTGGC